MANTGQSQQPPLIFAQSVSTKVRGSSLETSVGAKKSALTGGAGRTAQTRSLNESRQQIMGEFLPKVEPGQSKSTMGKDKMNVTHYYT